MIDLEDCFVAEARRQGWQPNKGDMTELAITMAGSQVKGDFIHLPSGYSIHVRDAVKSLRSSRGSQEEPGKPADADTPQRATTLSERMRMEVERNRSRSLPSDWNDIRANKVGITADMMDSIASARP